MSIFSPNPAKRYWQTHYYRSAPDDAGFRVTVSEFPPSVDELKVALLDRHNDPMRNHARPVTADVLDPDGELIMRARVAGKESAHIVPLPSPDNRKMAMRVEQ